MDAKSKEGSKNDPNPTCASPTFHGVAGTFSLIVHRTTAARLEAANFPADEADRGFFGHGVAARATSRAIMAENDIISLRNREKNLEIGVSTKLIVTARIRGNVLRKKKLKEKKILKKKILGKKF